MRFFYLNFNARGILAQKIYNAHTIFCQFCNIKNEGQSQQPSALGHLVTDQTTRISCPKESLCFLQFSLLIVFTSASLIASLSK